MNVIRNKKGQPQLSFFHLCIIELLWRQIVLFSDLKSWVFHISSFSFIFSSANLTAAITKAENMQFLHTIAFSISWIQSSGNLMVLFVASEIFGILNSLISYLLYKNIISEYRLFVNKLNQLMIKYI